MRGSGPNLKRLLQSSCRFAAIAAGRAQELGSRSLARCRHRLTQQHGGISDRYRKGCSHTAWQAAGCSANSRPNVRCTTGRTHTLDPLRSFRKSPRDGPSVVQLLGAEAIVNGPNTLTQLVQNPSGLQRRGVGFHRAFKTEHLSSKLAPSKAESHLPVGHMPNLWSNGQFT